MTLSSGTGGPPLDRGRTRRLGRLSGNPSSGDRLRTSHRQHRNPTGVLSNAIKAWVTSSNLTLAQKDDLPVSPVSASERTLPRLCAELVELDGR